MLGERREDMDIKNMKPAKGYIYSNSLGEMVVKAFIYKGERFEWNDADCLYYSDSTDERWLEDLPVNADSADLTILQ